MTAATAFLICFSTITTPVTNNAGIPTIDRGQWGSGDVQSGNPKEHVVMPGSRKRQGPRPMTTAPAPRARSQGWTDLLAKAGPKLEGWTRGPLPAHRASSAPARSGRSIRPPGFWSARVTAATSGFAGTKSWGLHLPRRVAIHRRSGQERLQFGNLRPQLGRCHDLAPGPDRRWFGRISLR